MIFKYLKCDFRKGVAFFVENSSESVENPNS